MLLTRKRVALQPAVSARLKTAPAALLPGPETVLPARVLLTTTMVPLRLKTAPPSPWPAVPLLRPVPLAPPAAVLAVRVELTRVRVAPWLLKMAPPRPAPPPPPPSTVPPVPPPKKLTPPLLPPLPPPPPPPKPPAP